jgi:hypothetical protein
MTIAFLSSEVKDEANAPVKNFSVGNILKN